MITKIKHQTMIFKMKRFIRNEDASIRQLNSDIRRNERHLQCNDWGVHDRFKKNRIEKDIEAQRLRVRELIEFINRGRLILSDLLINHMSFNPTDHDIAQILGISHIAYAHFKSEYSDRGDIWSAAFMGAETFCENEEWKGAGRRDCPLFDCTMSGFLKEYDSNAKLRTATSDVFKETFGVELGGST